MAMMSAGDQARLQEAFAQMTRPVRLLFFTQTVGCDTCLQARQILDELPPLSDKIAIEEVNFILEPDRAARYGVDRAPAVALVAGGGNGPDAVEDSHIRFVGTPSGYEFASLVQAVLLVGGRPSSILSEESRRQIEAVESPMTIQVFTTPTCPHCPRAVAVAHEMAFLNPHITAYAVETTEFPDLARKYQVSGVPKTVVNDSTEILGALPPDVFVSQALAGVPKVSDAKPS
jgi:glutaredoxin-like protein